jgi:biopolymer transport protein ExbD
MAKVKIQKKDIWIDMTPMSDVMTLLLCFFMLTSTFLAPEPIQVTTPNSVSEVKVPESNVLNILVSPEGNIYLGTDNKNHMKEMMLTMTDAFSINLNATQQKHFLEDAMVGAPMDKLAAYLSLEPEKMAQAIQKLGIPTDSINGGMSEFQMWVKAARDANPDIKIAIKADAKTTYKTVKSLMSELQDMSENRYQLITNLKTASEE